MAAWSMLRFGVALAVIGWAGVSVADAPSGTVLAVIQSAQSVGANGEVVLNVSSPVYAGDHINTGPVGEAQIKFMDNTKLVVGPNSSMVIDAFVFSSNNTAKQITIDAAKGVFRFFTGVSQKNAYQINTPTATIGVRGTQFDISIESQGTTRIANFEGQTQICPLGTTNRAGCSDSKDPCTLSVIRPSEAKVTTYGNKDIEFRNRQLKYYFNYVRDQSSLRPDFQVNLKPCRLADVIPQDIPPIVPVIPGSPSPIIHPTVPSTPTPPTPPPGSIPPPAPPSDSSTDQRGTDPRPLFR
ncbi:MAG TPA: FecR domain-containing protein [Bauldia sp.]|nr:FecR domain-containing protein [Bauldia sp.]